MLKRTHIMLHHSLTRDGSTASWGELRRHHVDTLGWRAIGYHFGIELVGDYYEVLLGRSELERAAACRQSRMNLLALHVCCVGNFDREPPPRAMLEPLVELVIAPAMVEYGIPAEHIVGHRDFNTEKSCPGAQFDLEVVRRMCRPLTQVVAPRPAAKGSVISLPQRTTRRKAS